MANKNPSLKTRFKHGQVANPRGAGAHSQALKQIRNLTAQEVVEVGSMILKNDLSSLEDLARSKGASVLTRMIAAVVTKVIKTGDMHALDTLLNRVVGKVKDKIEVTDSDGGPRVILYIPDNGRAAPTNLASEGPPGVTLTMPCNGSEAPGSFQTRTY